MKLHALMLIKNEGDFIERSLRHSSQFFDAIYVFDNGSTDDTWRIVRELAGELPQVVPFKSDPRVYEGFMRGEIFNAYKVRAQSGDWWCQLDGDEIYPEHPARFLSGVPRAHHVIWSLHQNFYVTEADVTRWDAGVAAARADFADLPRHYLVNHSEPRWFRHRAGLRWLPGNSYPHHMGVVHPRRLLVRHYQYRSPVQIQQRFDTRREALARGGEHFEHWTRAHWRDAITAPDGLHELRDGAAIRVDESVLPWHLESAARRLTKRVLHSVGIWP